jgi:hypothetical protein
MYFPASRVISARNQPPALSSAKGLRNRIPPFSLTSFRHKVFPASGPITPEHQVYWMRWRISEWRTLDLDKRAGNSGARQGAFRGVKRRGGIPVACLGRRWLQPQFPTIAPPWSLLPDAVYGRLAIGKAKMELYVRICKP